MIELTRMDGTKISMNVELFWPALPIDGTAIVLIESDRDRVRVKESYDEIKAKLRQQRVNDLAERLLAGLMSDFFNGNNDWSDSSIIEHSMIMANKLITEQEKRNGNT